MNVRAEPATDLSLQGNFSPQSLFPMPITIECPFQMLQERSPQRTIVHSAHTSVMHQLQHIETYIRSMEEIGGSAVSIEPRLDGRDEDRELG